MCFGTGNGKLHFRKIIWAGNLVLLAAAGHLAFGLLKSPSKALPPSQKTASGVQESAKAAVALPDVAQKDVDIILKRNLFDPGKGGAARPSARRRRSPDPQTKSELRLRLLGSVAGDRELACAIIEDLSTKAQKIYKIGDTVQDARLESIQIDRVTLNRQGRIVVLEIKLTGPASKPPSRGRKRVRTPAPRRPRPDEAVTILSPSEIEIKKDAFLARVGGIQAIMKAAKLTPHYDADGKMDGLKLTGLEKISMARYIGLRDGDVVHKVNGQKLSKPGKALQVFKKLRGQSYADIELLRGDEKTRLHFRLK